MTFGSTLRELTNLCGVKRCNLAAALGYDPSYVSRWINDVKLPANTEHNPLLRNIAAYLTANATLEAREKIACRFSLDLPSPDDGQFSQSLEDLLAEAYRNTQAASPQTPQKTGRENAVLFRAKDAGAIPESIFDVLRSGAALEPRVDMLCTMPIHTQFKNNEPFFRRIRAMLPADTDIHITQFVDMNDLAGSVDASCRSFCYLMGAPHGIQYDFYELTPHRKNYGMTYLIRDGVLLQYLRSPFSKDLLLLETTDAELIARYCSEANNYIMNRPAINARPELEKLLKNQYFLEYFMRPRCRCLLKRMQPLFFPEELQRRFLAREQTRGRQMGLFLDGSRFFESMILFKSAFVDYIYTGRLMAFGHTFVIPRKDRLAHLRYMLDTLSQAPEQPLYILSTENQLCSFEDQPTSLFLSRSAAFALKHDDGRDQVTYTLTSTPMIDHLNTWLDHIEALPPDQCLSGAEAIEYISRCIQLL